MKVIISAGGTGGHIYPAIAIIDKIKLKNKKVDILYIGTTDRMEKDIVPNLGISYEGIEIKGLSKNPFKLIKAIFLNLKALKKCKKIIKSFNPDIVIGVGGYVTVPVLYSAHKLGIKTLLHEQNSIPGKANKFLSNFVDKICVSFSSTLSYFNKGVYTGNPRSEEANNAIIFDKSKFGLSFNKKLVFIVMGSLGAQTVNEMLMNLIPEFNKKSYEIVISTGEKWYSKFNDIVHNDNIKIYPYVDDMLGLMKVTDVIVSRAGASTISEITAIGVPSIIIPSPYVANNHQYYNAKDLYDNNGCVLLEEKNLTGEVLINNIDNLINDSILRKSLKENAKGCALLDSTERIYKEIENLLK